MAEEDFEGDEPEFESNAGGGNRKKMLLLIVLPLVLVLGGAAAAYFTGLANPLLAMFSKKPPAEAAAPAGAEPAKAEGEKAASNAPTAPYDVPEMLVNLNTGGRAKAFLKIKVKLELNSDADVNRVENMQAYIVDSFQVYLRELRLEDLQGTAGTTRVREELINRVNALVSPVKVKDVLFVEMVVQ